MSVWRTHGGLLAVLVSVALVIVIGLAAAGAFAGCREQTKKGGRPSQAVSASSYGAIGTVTAKAFARTVHPRVADTWGEIRGREFVTAVLQQYGLSPSLQEFIAGEGANRVHSANVIAVKPGASPKQLVVGAHYDSVATGEGYVDNATGVGLLIELAARLKAVTTPYTLVFVAFGAEERGALGSRHFVQAMSDDELRATVGMIDLDAPAGGGDTLYATNLPDSPSWLRDDALAAAGQLKVPVEAGPEGSAGQAGLPPGVSDDLAFALAGIPTVAFTAGGVAGEGGGGTSAAVGPRLWHSRNDTVAYVESQYPGRVRRQLGQLSRLLETLLTSKLERHP